MTDLHWDPVLLTEDVGFTGSRRGMTDPQGARLRQILSEGRRRVSAFHHGDCVGADAEAHAIAIDLGIPVAIHPSTHHSRAWCEGATLVAFQMAPLDRNRVIVDGSDLLLVAPSGIEEEQRSGTWATYRYARKQHVPTILIFPDGSISIQGGEKGRL